MGGETGTDPDDETDDVTPFIWESVDGDDENRDTDDSPPETGEVPSGTGDGPSGTGDRAGKPADSTDESDRKSEPEPVDLETLITEEPAEGDGDTDRDRGDDSDRLWNRFGSDDRGVSTQSGGSADASSEPGPNESKRNTPTASEPGDAGTAAGGGETVHTEPDTPDRGTSFDRLLARSESGSSNPRPVGSPSVETDLDAFFSDLEQFDRATSGSQVLVISPSGHSITDEVCSRLLTAGGVSGRNVMFVTAVESASERVEICHDNDDWAGGKVGVIELGNTGTESPDILESVGGEEVVHRRVSSPRNLSKTGLLITLTLKEWSEDDRPSILCFHTLTAISGYVETDVLFQFLFTLQAKLNSFGVTGHYHMDANKHDQQEINTLRTLFDLVITVSRNGEIEVE